MKKIKEKFKKGITGLCIFAMVVSIGQNVTGVSRVMASGLAEENSFVKAADFASLETGRIIFGKNEKGSEQEWLIAGRDAKISGNNVIIIAANPIKENQAFQNEGKRNEKNSELWMDCDYVGESNITEVHPNHYGASDLRAVLKEMVDENTYFSNVEKTLFNATKITSYDTRNRVSYTTTDKLYPLASVNGKLMAGSDDSVEVQVDESDFFWLRTPNGLMDDKGNILAANKNSADTSVSVEFSRAVVPAANLDVSSVIFASAATTEKSGQIDKSAAMKLRLDGSNKAIGSVQYDKTTGNIAVKPDEAAKGAISVIVLGKGVIDGKECDWYYTKEISSATTVTSKMIKDELNITSEISLADCKIWVEDKDDAENLSYARMATEGEVPNPSISDEKEDNDKPSSSVESEQNKENGTTADMGDHTQMLGMLCLALVSVVAIAAVHYIRSKQNKNAI